MKSTNGYISYDRATSLIEKGWIFKQDLAQTSFRIAKSENSLDYFKLNKKTATEVKKHLTLKRTQTKLL